MNWVLTAVLLKVESLDVLSVGCVSTYQRIFIITLKLLQDGVIFVCVMGNTVKSYSPTDAVGCCVVMSPVIQ